jgi:hypothetical protein
MRPIDPSTGFSVPLCDRGRFGIGSTCMVPARQRIVTDRRGTRNITFWCGEHQQIVSAKRLIRLRRGGDEVEEISLLSDGQWAGQPVLTPVVAGS